MGGFLRFIGIEYIADRLGLPDNAPAMGFIILAILAIFCHIMDLDEIAIVLLIIGFVIFLIKDYDDWN